MADKRINALTTTSASVGDDYFAIDGATNGTRALSAFSPTFGGNATVTGNLTVNGTGNSLFAGQLIQVADPATIALWKDATPTKAARFQFNTLADNGFSLGVYDGSSWVNAITVAPTTGVVKVTSTSASTTTSTGALVVGNGTSGGLGVGGAINAGGAITSNNGSGSGQLGMRSSSGNASYVFWSETGVADRGILGFNNGSSTLSYRSAASSFATGTEVFSVTSAGNITTGGNITTAAPAGGTAAAWKLGTVATVSPTSPNRTIEVDIGGTIYYIHAKTTNN